MDFKAIKEEILTAITYHATAGQNYVPGEFGYIPALIDVFKDGKNYFVNITYRGDNLMIVSHLKIQDTGFNEQSLIDFILDKKKDESGHDVYTHMSWFGPNEIFGDEDFSTLLDAETQERLLNVFPDGLKNYLLHEYFKNQVSYLVSGDTSDTTFVFRLETPRGNLVKFCRDMNDSYVVVNKTLSDLLEPNDIKATYLFGECSISLETFLRNADKLLEIETVPELTLLRR